MKSQHIMDDQFVKFYSELTTTAPEHDKFNTKYASDSIRLSASGLGCTLDYPAAKTINVLAPVVKKRRSSDGKKRDEKGEAMCTSPDHPPAFESTANKIFTKELLSSNLVDQARTTSYFNHGISTFEEDLLRCLVASKKVLGNSGGKGGSDSSSGHDNCSETYSSSVRFSNITIQEYSVQPGDNPGGNKGCPLTIGWEPINVVNVDLDVFEKVRCENRRRSPQLKLVSAHREQILQGMGYSKKDIMEGTKAANKARRSRYQTIARLNFSESQEKLESVRNNVHNFVTLGSKKRRERKLLAAYKGEKKGSQKTLCDSDSVSTVPCLK